MSAEQNPRVLEALFRVEAMSIDVAEIKGAMRDLAIAVSKLAVIEERQVHDRAEITRVFKRLDNHEGRIGEIEKQQPLTKQATDWFGRVVAAVLTAVATAVASTVIVSKSYESKQYAPVQMPPVITAPK